MQSDGNHAGDLLYEISADASRSAQACILYSLGITCNHTHIIGG